MKNATEKLSKRNGDASYQDLVAKGYLPPAIVNYLALLGWAPKGEQEIFTMEELKKESLFPASANLLRFLTIKNWTTLTRNTSAASRWISFTKSLCPGSGKR